MIEIKNPLRTKGLITKAASLVTIIIGCIVFTGWILKIPAFKSIMSDFGIMKFITAICFILSGITLYVINAAPLVHRNAKLIASIFSSIILATGLLSLSHYIFDWNVSFIDVFLKENTGPENIFYSGRMSLIVSFNFTLLGFVFLILGKRKYNWLIQALVICIIPGSLLVILNHLFGISFLNSIPLSAPTSLNTAILFILLSIGIFFSPAIGFLQFSFVKKMAGFFVLIFLFRSLIFFAINKSNKQDVQNQKNIHHNNLVISFGERLIFQSIEMDNETKEFIISGDKNYPFYLIPKTISIQNNIDSLKEITRGETSQQLRIDSLEKNYKGFVNFQNALLQIRMDKGFAAAQKAISNGDKAILLNKINLLIKDIEQAEDESLAKNKSYNLVSIRNTSRLLTLFQIIAVLLFLVALKMIYHNSLYRNKVEGELRDSLKDISDYKHALDESSILVITDHDGIIKKVNNNFCKITKYKRDEFIGQDHRIINSGFHSKEFIRDMWIVINNGEIWRGEIKNKAKDGSCFWLDTTIVPFMNEKGKPYQYVAISSDITKRKELEDEIKLFNKDLQKRVKEKTEEALAKDQQYRFLLQNMREGIQIIGFDWRYIFVNDSALERSKYKNEDLLGYTIMERYPGIENTEYFQALKRCMKKRIPQVLEEEFSFPGDIKRCFELSIQPVPEGLFILSMEITDRKKAESALTESENYLRTIIETEPECVKLLNENGEVLDMNPAGLSMIEADTLQQVKGKSLLGLIGEPYRKSFKELIQNIFKGISAKIEFEITGFKGTHRWMETHAVPIKNTDGKVITLLSVTRDISDRKKAEEKLRESLTRYELVNKATGDTIWEWDMNTDEITWNDLFTTLYGYRKDQYKKSFSTSGYENIHPSDKEKIAKNIKNCIENKLDYWHDEYRFLDADGNYRNVYDRAFIQYNGQGQPVRMVGAMTDLTEKKKLEKELTEQRMHQQKLLTEVALQAQEKEKNELGKELHDNINQILSTVKIYLGMLKGGKDIPEDDLMNKSYEYVSTAIDELRKLSHSLVAPSLGEIGLEDALLALADDTRMINKFRVHLCVEETYKKHDVDKNIELMVYRIVQEQLNNVTKYSKATKVVINVSIQDSNLFLVVSDNGIGFDISKKTKGIGLKNISNRVAFYCGDVNIISEPGQGCKLIVNVPLECGQARDTINNHKWSQSQFENHIFKTVNDDMFL